MFMMTMMKSGGGSFSSRSLGSFRVSKKNSEKHLLVEEDEISVIDLETDLPLVGSIEVVIPDTVPDADSVTASTSAEVSSPPSSSSSLTRRCVQIVCRPPEDQEEVDNEFEDGDVLVRFLVESINDLVDRRQHEGEEEKTSLPKYDEEEEQETVQNSVIEALSFACLNTCGTTGLGPTFPFTSSSPLAMTRNKSILRTRGSDSNCRSPTEAGVLSDRTVSFSQLEIHEFDMTLGDHPSAVSGPPVALDYNSNATKVIDVEEYERDRTPRRARRQLKLSYHDKCETLQNRGFSLQEVHDAWAEAIRIRKQRQETVQQSQFMMLLDDMWESTGRKYQRVMESLAIF